MAESATQSSLPSRAAPAVAHSDWWSRMFTEHPADVNETYFEHLRAASSFAGGLAICTVCCFVHALVPGLFTTSASARVERMHERMHNRGKPRTD